MLRLFPRLRRNITYRLQRLEFYLRRNLPEPVFRALKPFYRRFGRQPPQRASLEHYASLGSARPAAYTIICFPIITWEYRYQRPQQLLSRFAKAGHRVYYLRTDFRAGDMAAEPITSNIYGLCLPGPSNLNIYSDPLTPELLDRWVNSLDALRRDKGLDDVICLVQLPFWGPLALKAREKWGWRVVYDCMDEHSGFPGVQPDMLAQESPLISQSDLVLTTARALYEKCMPVANRCILLPNAADFEHFQRPGDPNILADLNGPVIGYYGAIANWFDAEIVRRAALAHPEWNFVLIGSDPETDLSILERQPNVHLLGELPYAQLPDYLHRFDVAIIPFRLNPLTRATNPVKFYEYLSGGRPIVTTPLPELEPYRHLLYFASNPEEFISQIEHALTERDPARSAARISLAKQNVWADRAAVLDHSIRQLYDRVSIIIVSHNHLDRLRQCLDSIWAKTAHPNFEVIVVDNNSTPDVLAYLRHTQIAHHRLKFVACSSDLGWAQAANVGLAAANDPAHIVFLSCDTIVARGWLTRLIQHLQQDPSMGMVGPVIGWAGDDARAVTGYHSVHDLELFAERRALTHNGQSTELPALDLFCAALRRNVLDEIGPLDERFGQGVFEDADYALRLRRAGYRLARAEDAVVHHWATSSEAGDADDDSLFERNRRLFEEKWGQRWEKSVLPVTRPANSPPRGLVG